MLNILNILLLLLNTAYFCQRAAIAKHLNIDRKKYRDLDSKISVKRMLFLLQIFLVPS